jgi:hypothetical protein
MKRKIEGRIQIMSSPNGFDGHSLWESFICVIFSHEIILSICIIADILNMPENLSAYKLLVSGNGVLGLM